MLKRAAAFRLWLLTVAVARSLPWPHEVQAVLADDHLSRTAGMGVGHFSEWSRETKRQFLIDWQAGKSSEWILVQGNEGGDLDSMTAALTWAYHLGHSTENSSHPVKAIALL